MSGIPTIVKYENKVVMEEYYGHPEWKERMLLVDELSTDMEKIKEYVAEIMK